MNRKFISAILIFTMLLGSGGASLSGAYAQTTKGLTQDQQAMDKLMAPIALYPDALLAQTLACASSPQQVTEVNSWLKKNSQLKGTDLQQAAETAGFDASFIALVLFPDVLTLLGQNMQWTTEVGNAFSSNQKQVLESVQRLRAQAQAAGNLKTTPQQEVKKETQGGQTVIVIEPANPQVVYVPVYNAQTVYAPAPPPEDDSGEKVAAAVIGFAIGVALGSAMDDDYGYYGWGAWGVGWHSSTVIIHGGAWHIPPAGRYPYVRPTPYYHPPANVYAPRYNDVNININNNRNTNINNRQANKVQTTPARTPRPTTTTAATRPAAATTASNKPAATSSGRGRAQANKTASSTPAKQIESGSKTGAFSGYQKGSSEKAASARGRSSSSSKSSREGRRR